jgi:hypothetical protein
MGPRGEAAEGGPPASPGLRVVQRWIYHRDFLPKIFFVDPLKLFPGFQILLASPLGDRDAIRVPPPETGTGSVRCRS